MAPTISEEGTAAGESNTENNDTDNTDNPSNVSSIQQVFKTKLKYVEIVDQEYFYVSGANITIIIIRFDFPTDSWPTYYHSTHVYLRTKFGQCTCKEARISAVHDRYRHFTN